MSSIEFQKSCSTRLDDHAIDRDLMFHSQSFAKFDAKDNILPYITSTLKKRSNHWIKRSISHWVHRNDFLHYIYYNNLPYRNETSARSRVQIWYTEIHTVDLRDKDSHASVSLSDIYNFASDHDTKRKNRTRYLRVRAQISSHRYYSLRETSEIVVDVINC